jgi:small subunit ribosomal protein S5
MAKDRNKNRRGERENKEYEEEILQIDRVTRVVKGGRRMRFRVTVVVGNKKGKVGIGIGKALEVADAIRKAVSQAKKRFIIVPLVGEGTIPHALKIKHKAARLWVSPAAPGAGVVAGGALRKVVELAGVRNILAKSLGTSNRLVVGQCAIKLLKSFRPVRAGAKKAEEINSQKVAKADVVPEVTN